MLFANYCEYDEIVISDTSCLITLENVGLFDLLRQLYTRVIATALKEACE
jgi:predicted nucleic acid-binding protein